MLAPNDTNFVKPHPETERKGVDLDSNICTHTLSIQPTQEVKTRNSRIKYDCRDDIKLCSDLCENYAVFCKYN